MKKYILLCLACMMMGPSIMAQDEQQEVFTNKKGVAVLPVKGDYAIGLKVDPFLTYVGNMFNKSENNVFNLNENTLFGKYFIADDQAVRGYLTIGQQVAINRQYVSDDAAGNNPLSLEQVVDREKQVSSFYEIGIGYEFRRGHRRIQGFYGGSVHYSYSASRFVYDYGNEMNEFNTTPTSTDFGNNLMETGRVTKRIASRNNMVGVAAFAGVEYFIAPKLCIGAQIMLQGSYDMGGKLQNTMEYWNGEVIEHVQNTEPGDFDFDMFTNSTHTNMYLIFHF